MISSYALSVLFRSRGRSGPAAGVLGDELSELASGASVAAKTSLGAPFPPLRLRESPSASASSDARELEGGAALSRFLPSPCETASAARTEGGSELRSIGGPAFGCSREASFDERSSCDSDRRAPL